MQIQNKPKQIQIIAAFSALYLIWGSTFIAMRFAIETIPPLLMLGMRFFLAGLIVYMYIKMQGGVKHKISHWFHAGLAGILTLGIGTGSIILATKTLPSGLIALLVAIVPIYVAILNWLRPNGIRPNKQTIIGLIIGILGIVLLIGPSQISIGQHLDLFSVLIVLLGSLFGATGLLYIRHAPLPNSAVLSTAIQMIVSGLVLIAVSILIGEAKYFDVSLISFRSITAFVYLIIFGSLIGYSSYVWLLNVVSPQQVSTYAYVNPVIALFLGWAMAGESFTWHTAISAAIILAAVWLITSGTAASSRSTNEIEIPLGESQKEICALTK